jgi:hypothetical protein
MASQRTLVGAVMLTAIVTALIAALVFAVLLERGREGPGGPQGVAGPEGPRGPTGKRGRTPDSIRPVALVKAIKEDPGAISDAIADAQGLGSTAPDTGGDSSTDLTTVEDDINQLRDDLQAVCDAVRSSSDVSTSDLPC